MSEGEIEFETAESPNFKIVSEGVNDRAEHILQNRFNAATVASKSFDGDARKSIDANVTKPPGRFSVAGALVDIVMAATELLIPEEAKMAKRIYDDMHASWELSKATFEVAEKFTHGTEEHDLEKAREYLKEFAGDISENILRSAAAMIKAGQGAVGAQLEEYVNANPQVFKLHDTDYYSELCKEIGLVDPDINNLADQIANAAMRKFLPELEKVTAALHFFHEMSDNVERLNFLIEISEKGTDPDQFLKLIGGDQAWWDKYLNIYRSEGKDAALAAVLMGG